MKRADYRVASGPVALGLGVMVSIAGGAEPLLPPVGAQRDSGVNALEVAMFSMLPAEVQTDMAIGYVTTQLRSEGAFAEPFEATDERYAMVSHVITRERFDALSDAHRRAMIRVADRLEHGEVPMAACFAPGTDPAYVWEMSELLYNVSSRFQQTTRWNNTATDGPGSGGQGNPITLTYSYVPDGTPLSGSPSSSSLFSWLNGIYGSPATWQPLFDQVFDRWEELMGVTYVYEPNDDGITFGTSTNRGELGVRGDVRIGAVPIDGNFGILAFNDFPQNGDMVFDSGDNFYNFTGNNSIRLRNVIAHEHGHGLGMLHVCPQNGTKLMEPSASTAFDGPQLDDILNGQRHYGDPLEVGGDVTTLGQVGFPGVSITQVSIDDNADVDWYTIDIASPSDVFITATPTGETYLQGVQTQACNNGGSFNSRAIHDLSIAFFDTDIVTLLEFANNSGLEGSEFLTLQIQDPGTYWVRISGSGTNNIQLYSFTASVQALPDDSCNEADLAEPLGVLDFSDVIAFLAAFGAMDPDADLAAPFGTYDFSDVVAFLSAFGAGCP